MGEGQRAETKENQGGCSQPTTRFHTFTNRIPVLEFGTTGGGEEVRVGCHLVACLTTSTGGMVGPT